MEYNFNVWEYLVRGFFGQDFSAIVAELKTSLVCCNKLFWFNFCVEKMSGLVHFNKNMSTFENGKVPSGRKTVIINEMYFLKKWATSDLFFILFSSFQTNMSIFTTNVCEKWPSSIWCRDSNPRPSGHEFPPITTTPWLPP